MIESFKKRFREKGYNFKKGNNTFLFSKDEILFKVIQQNFNEFEIYFSNSKKRNIKLDFTLDLYLGNLTLNSFIDDFVGEKTIEEIQIYYYKLLFDSGKFLVENNKKEVDNFIDWHEIESENVYIQYIRLLKQKNKV